MTNQTNENKPAFTKNEDGTVTVVLSAESVAKLEALQKGALDDHPILSMLTSMTDETVRKLRAKGEHEKADELQAVVSDTMAERMAAVDYERLTSSVIQAAHEGMKKSKEFKAGGNMLSALEQAMRTAPRFGDGGFFR